MSYKSYQIQDVSSEFRNAARRLSRTDYSQCDTNLKRLIAVINSQDIIKCFIIENNVFEYDIGTIIKERNRLEPFEVSPIIKEEISFEYQLLIYAIENFDGDFTKLYGTHWYTSMKTTINDEMQKFIDHIIDPFIDYISEYLRQLYEIAVREESKSNSPAVGGITANYSTVVVGSNVDGNISTQVTISDTIKNDAIELVDEIKKVLQENDMNEKEDIVAVLNQIEEDLHTNQKPKKGFLTALKALCAGSTTIITFVTALIKLLST